MKKFSIITSLCAFMILAAGCKKNEIKYGEFDRVTDEQALLKINFVSAYYSNPGFYISVDGNRISNVITSRTPFPGGGYNTSGGSTADYLALTPGKHSMTFSIPKKGTVIDSIPEFYQAVFTIQAGKKQTLHLTDTATNTQSVLITDNVSRPDSGNIRYNFVHLMPNVPALDLYFGTTLVAANIPYKGNKEFTMPLPAGTLAWTVYPAGTTPAGTGLATYNHANTIANSRVYTVFALGYAGVTDARKPYLSFLLNL